MSRLGTVALALLLLGGCASSGSLTAPSGPQPCVYGLFTARTHLSPTLPISLVWERLGEEDIPVSGPNGVVRIPIVPGSSDPLLLNREQTARALVLEYPRDLRDAGIAGETVLLIWVGADGQVQQIRTLRPSVYAAFDAAAGRVARVMRFSPAVAGDCAVPAFAVVPISFFLVR